MSVWLSLNLVAIVLSIVSYYRVNKLPAEDKVAQAFQKSVLAGFFAGIFASQILWLAHLLQFTTWAKLDLAAIILIVYLICYGFYLDRKRSRAVIVYFALASSLLTLTIISECLRYFFTP